MSDDNTPQRTVDELNALIEKELEEAQGRIETYEERCAMAQEAHEDGKTTDERAIEAMDREERFHGERQVAWAWLMHSKTARIWKSKADR